MFDRLDIKICWKEDTTLELIECSKLVLDENTSTPTLAESVKKDLLKSGQYFVTVYTKKSKTLRFFPTKNEIVWWIKISISSFSPETSGEILARLNKLVSEFVYSTGICISSSECFWDGIVLEPSFKKSKENLIEELSDIPNVTKVEINEIK